MKITIESYGKIHSSEISDQSTIDEVADILKGLLLLCGYHIDSINEILPEIE